MSLPALPALGRSVGAAPDRVQLTLSLFVLGYGAGQLFCGPLSDRFGRKPILLWGLAVYTVAALAAALAADIEAVVWARLVQGLGAAVGPVLGRAVIRDHWEGTRAAQALSHVMVVFALAPLVAPLLGSVLLALWSWRAIFLAFAAFGGVLLLATALALRESLRLPDREALAPRRLRANVRAFFLARRSVGFAIVNCCTFAGVFAFLSGSPFVFIAGYGISPERFGLYFALVAAAIMAGALANSRALRRLAPEHVLRIGIALLAASGLGALIIAASPWSAPLPLMLAVMGYVFGQGLTVPNATAAAMEPLAHMAGMGASLMGAAQMLVASLVGYAATALYDGTALPMAAFIAAMGIGACLSYYLLVPPPANITGL
jgi:DHA1 family bicyclomycin/chloramphenicol resistance-like MFS transporter